MPFAASESLPHLCGACWHPKDVHAVGGECPDAGSAPAPAPAERAPR